MVCDSCATTPSGNTMNATTTRHSVANMATAEICMSPLAIIASHALPAMVPAPIPANMKATPSPKICSAFSLRRRDTSTNSTQVRMSKNS